MLVDITFHHQNTTTPDQSRSNGQALVHSREQSRPPVSPLGAPSKVGGKAGKKDDMGAVVIFSIPAPGIKGLRDRAAV